MKEMRIVIVLTSLVFSLACREKHQSTRTDLSEGGGQISEIQESDTVRLARRVRPTPTPTLTPAPFDVHVIGQVVNENGKAVEGAKVVSKLQRCTNHGEGKVESVSDAEGAFDQNLHTSRCKKRRPLLTVCATHKDDAGCESRRVINGQEVNIKVKILPPPPPSTCDSCTWNVQCPGPYHCLNGCCEYQYSNRCYTDFDCWPNSCEGGVCVGT